MAKFQRAQRKSRRAAQERSGPRSTCWRRSSAAREAGPEGKLSRGAELVQAMIASALGGDVNAQKEILNRTIGRVPVAMPPEALDLEAIAMRMEERRRSLTPRCR